jgi:hypothetical protein
MYSIIVEYNLARVKIKTQIVKPTREECIAQAEEYLNSSTAYSYNIISEGAVNE